MSAMNTKASEFGRFHPIVQFGYFTSVILFTMFIREPVFLGISFVAVMTYSLYLGRRKTIKALLTFIMPMVLLIAVINPLFNHGGVTIWFYLPDGNPFTMESLVYGFVSGGLFASTMMWCMCMGYIVTSDRVIYLFGRAAPKWGLLISMILRFIPKLSAHFRQVRHAQKNIGRDITDGNFKERIANGVKIISSMLQWVTENSIDTANSLESRGYGLPHRTSFSLFRFEKRDGILLLIVVICDTAIIWGYMGGILEFDYFPMISEIQFHAVLTAVYGILCSMPLALDIAEERKWNNTELKI